MAIIGYYNSKNIGDDAFKSAFNRLISEGVKVIYESSGRVDNTRVRDLERSGYSIILGGGAIIGEPYFWESIAKGVRYSIASADIGGSDCHLEQYKDSFSRIRKGWIRSKADLARLLRYTDNPNIKYAPDAVFGIPKTEVGQVDSSDRGSLIWQKLDKIGALLRRDGFNPNNKNLGVFMSDHYLDLPALYPANAYEARLDEAHHLQFEHHLSRALEELLPYYNIYMIGMSLWHNAIDSYAAHRVKRITPNGYKIGLTLTYLELQEFVDIVSLFDCCISMKYHGLVIPITQAVPVINIGSSSKNVNLCNEQGILSVPYPALKADELLKAVMYAETPEYTESIAKISATNRSLVDQMSDFFIS